MNGIWFDVKVGLYTRMRYTVGVSAAVWVADSVMLVAFEKPFDPLKNCFYNI